jgi:hypothetical protein
MSETPGSGRGPPAKDIPRIALLLMLAGVLMPSVFYSYHLRDPTPSELLLAICIGVFSSVVYLWILDAVSILRFRAEWIGKSIYGAAMASILGTSAAVYKNAFSDSQYPYEGRWDLQVFDDGKKEEYFNSTVALVYSVQSDAYWGYSNYRWPPSSNPSAAWYVWIGIDDFDPKASQLATTARAPNGGEVKFRVHVEKQRAGKQFEGKTENITIRLARPN